MIASIPDSQGSQESSQYTNSSLGFHSLIAIADIENLLIMRRSWMIEMAFYTKWQPLMI